MRKNVILKCLVLFYLHSILQSYKSILQIRVFFEDNILTRVVIYSLRLSCAILKKILLVIKDAKKICDKRVMEES